MGNLLRDLATLGAKGRVIIMQCDTRIRQEDVYESLSDAPVNPDTMEMKGWGGTSFVPVFQRLDEIKNSEGRSIDALFFLTDGEGCYPDKPPDFPTFFIVEENEFFGRDTAKKLRIQILEIGGDVKI